MRLKTKGLTRDQIQRRKKGKQSLVRKINSLYKKQETLDKQIAHLRSHPPARDQKMTPQEYLTIVEKWDAKIKALVKKSVDLNVPISKLREKYDELHDSLSYFKARGRAIGKKYPRTDPYEWYGMLRR